MAPWTRLTSRLTSLLTARASQSRKLQAELDFTAACPLLQLHEAIVGGERDPAALEALFAGYSAAWRAPAVSLGDKIGFANDAMTLQLAEMLQHVADLDAGEGGVPATPPLLPPAHRRSSASTTPRPLDAAGPSSHTNPLPTLEFQMKELAAAEAVAAGVAVRASLAARYGFALWVGPSQAPTPTSVAGVYLKGRCPPGGVVGLLPGAVYNPEMRARGGDAGHLGDPSVGRALVPRFDEAVLDLHADVGEGGSNPYALGAHVRHPPPGVSPNVLRLPVDFVDGGVGGVGSGLPALPFPPHLRRYIPNVWGADTGVGGQLYGMLEQGIWMKGVALIALRPLWDEELFTDWALNPGGPRPPWYVPVDAEAEKRIWQGISV